MIFLYTGQNGTGKTYFAVKKIIEILEEPDRKIITNIDISIDSDQFFFKSDEEIMLEFLKIGHMMQNSKNQEASKEKLRLHSWRGYDIFVDEAQFCGFRKKNDGINDFLTLHRHMNCNIYLICPSSGMIHVDHRDLVHEHVQAVIPKKRVLPNYNMYKIFSPIGDKSFSNRMLKQDPSIYALYKAGKKEVGFNSDILKLLAIVLVLVVGAFFVVHVYRSGGFLPAAKMYNKPAEDENQTRFKLENCKIVSYISPIREKDGWLWEERLRDGSWYYLRRSCN